MMDKDLWEHLKDNHGFQNWSPELFKETYGDSEMAGVHEQDHADPQEYRLSHDHPLK